MSAFDWLADNTESSVIKPAQFEKEIKRLLKKIEAAERKQDLAQTAWLYQTAAVLASRAKRYQESVNYALSSARASQREGKLFNAGWSYRTAAKAAREQHDDVNALKHAMQGAECFVSSKNSYAAKWCYLTAGQASEDMGDFPRALRCFKRANEIERDEETDLEIARLQHVVSHPTVDQYPEKPEVLEYEPVRFEVVVENHGRAMVTDVVVGDRSGKISHEIASLSPGEVKVFSYEARGRLGRMHSPYNCVTWKNAQGEAMDMQLEPASVLVRPRIQVNCYVNPEPVLNKPSELVVLVKNLSSRPISDVKLDIDFPEHIKSTRSSPDTFPKIRPGEELGTGWKIKPMVLGEQGIATGMIIMNDEAGNRYEATIPAVEADVLDHEREQPGLPQKQQFRQAKAEFDRSINAYPVAEGQYVSLTNRYWHQQRGYTFRGASMDVVMRHAAENCHDMALVSKHEFKSERMLLYSFRMASVHYLLTVVIKHDSGFVHLILQLYSDNREGLVRALDRIANIIRYTIRTEAAAAEVEHVEIKKVVNIVDSIVQRSKIASAGDEGETGQVKQKVTKVKDSIVQRSGI